MEGPEKLESEPARPMNRAVWLVVAVVVVALAAGVVWDQRRSDQTTPLSISSPSASQAPSTQHPTSPPARSPSPTAPLTREPGRGEGQARPLADGLPAGTLYARSTDTLYAIDVLTGATVITPANLGTTDPVSMVAIDNGVLLQTWDSTPDYVVRDGRRPVRLVGLLTGAREVLPGPAGHLWVLSWTDQAPFDSTATLVDARGRRDGPRLVSPGGYSSDGRGGLLLTDVGGVWQAYPQPLRQVTTGSVTAVGSHHYQLLECDGRHRCTNTLLNQDTGHRTTLSARDRSLSDNTLVSPTGELAASISGYGSSQQPQITISKIADHTTLTTLPRPPDPIPGVPRAITWLSGELLAAITDGDLALYDTSAQQVTTPDLDLDDLIQLTWRPR